MSRPHPLLLDVAAGRPLQPVASEEHSSLLKSAAEHRMSGLLWTRVLVGELKLSPAAAAALAKEDLRSRSHNLLLWRTLDQIQRRLAEAGLDVVVAKGISTEVRWYTRTGERPCNDLDLVLSPRQVDRIQEVVEILQPTHPLRDTVRELMTSDVLQSIDLTVDGVEVDLHTDLLKYEIPTRGHQLLFDSAVPMEGPGGVQAWALSPEHSLVHYLLHLNKDNFARLLGYADVARILASPGLDWQIVDEFARGEGLRVHIYTALHEVTTRLDLAPAPVPVPTGLRATLWRALWPERRRLAGRTALVRQRHRQFMIPWAAEGRMLEAGRWWLRRRVLPPVALVDFYYADARGPYPLRLVSGRWSAMRRNREHARSVARAAALRPHDSDR